MLRFSVIVPVYNVEVYLPECVESLLKQDTAEPYEILLVDDGSIDSSGSCCSPALIPAHRALLACGYIWGCYCCVSTLFQETVVRIFRI